MHESVLTLAAAAVGTTVGILTLLGFAVKFVLLPWIRTEIVHPVQQTHHQVTVNHHSSETPTVLDRIDDVREEVRSVRADLSAHLLNSEQQQTEGHREAQRMWSAIEAIAKTQPPRD